MFYFGKNHLILKESKKEFFTLIWKFFKQCVAFFITIGRRFSDDRLTYSASALTYTTLLSLVPLVAVSLAVFSAFPIFSQVSGEVQKFIFQNLIPTSGQVIQNYLSQFSQQAAQLSVISTIFLIVTTVMMMLTIERALNDVWRIRKHRRGLSAILRYWSVLSLAPIVIVASIAATSYVVSLPIILGTAQALGVKVALLKSVPIILTILVFSLIYVVIPNCHVPVRYALLGAIVATILFEIAKRLFVIYVTHVATYELIYGALAVIPIFLLWVYCLWVIILFGALMSNILTTYYFTAVLGEIDGFTHAFLWLGFLWQAQQEGKGVTFKQLQKCLPGNYKVPADVQIEQLHRLNLVEYTAHRQYLLSRDFSKMTVGELYDILPWRFPKIADSRLFSDKLEALFNSAHQSILDTLDIPLGEVYEDFFKNSKPFKRKD